MNGQTSLLLISHYCLSPVIFRLLEHQCSLVLIQLPTRSNIYIMLNYHFAPYYRGAILEMSNGSSRYFEDISSPGVGRYQTQDGQQWTPMPSFPAIGSAHYVTRMQDPNHGTFHSSASYLPACGHDATIQWNELEGAEIPIGLTPWALWDDNPISIAPPGDETSKETQLFHTITHDAFGGAVKWSPEKQREVHPR